MMHRPIPENSFNVLLFTEKNLDRRYVEETAKWFERFPGPISVTVIKKSVELVANSAGVLAWSTIFSTLKKLRLDYSVAPEVFCYLLTRTKNEMNWFAAEDEEQMRNAFGHVEDFSWFTTAPVSVIASHYILKTVFNALLVLGGITLEDMWHKESRGCLFDFCKNKWELNIKLRTADICGDCMEALKSIGISDGLLQQAISIMESSRRLTLNTGQYLSQETAFERWPFPVAITRHKAVQASNPLLRFLLLLDHFDSLVRYFYISREVLAGNQPSITERPSLGWWVDQLSHSLKEERNFREIIAITEREQVVNLRNERRGHGWMASYVENYRNDALHLEEVLTKIEQELEPFLVSHRLLIPRQVTLQSGKYVIEGEHLVGSHLLHPKFKVELLDDPRSSGITSQDQIYIEEFNKNIFRCIFPYIVSEVCPMCQHPRILITDGGKQYIDILIGHRVHLQL
jgi:hypothetical protein